MKLWKILLAAPIVGVTSMEAVSVPIYLNSTNISVSVGSGTTSATSNNTFGSGGNQFTIEKVIDAATATSLELHNQSTHIWYSGGGPGAGLELLFDFGQQYDLETLHFWNFFGETFDVDNIEFSFFDENSTSVGSLSIAPELGDFPSIAAQDIDLAAPLNVQFVTAFLTSTNQQIDFQNIGFTASLSTDRCTINPSDPVCGSIGVPEPTGGAILLASLIGGGLLRRLTKLDVSDNKEK